VVVVSPTVVEATVVVTRRRELIPVVGGLLGRHDMGVTISD